MMSPISTENTNAPAALRLKRQHLEESLHRTIGQERMSFLAQNVTVTVITRNEEARLKELLESIPASIPILIVDSFSEDQTKALAESYGAVVYEHPFENYSRQKNQAVSYAKTPWILSLDADEALTPHSWEILGQTLQETQLSCYKIPRKLWFQGRTLSFGKTKDHPLRLFKRGEWAFQGAIHEALIPSAANSKASIGVLKKGLILHKSYQSLEAYLQKVNLYTSLLVEKNERSKTMCPSYGGIFLRFLWELFSRLFLRLGLLDGYQGFLYGTLSSFYVLLKLAKRREHILKARSMDPS